MGTFLSVFLGVFCALLAINIISWLAFYIWMYEPFKRTPKEPKPQATYRSADHA